MKLYGVEIVETIVKRVVIEAEDVACAQLMASRLSNDEFEYCRITEKHESVVSFDDEDEEDDNFGDESKDSSNECCENCDGCPDYCEVCGSCAKEADFVPNREKCASCPERCPACGACTFDE